MEEFADFDDGSSDLINEALREIAAEGYDCASVDLLLRLARDGDLESLSEIIGGLVMNSHPDWAGDILKMIMAKGQGEPDYKTSAWVLGYLIDTNLSGAHKLTPYLLVYQSQGPDCYDLALTLGHMAKSRKAAQGAKLLLAVYNDESAQGQNMKALVPFLLGTLVDNQHADWAAALLQHMCCPAGRGGSDYAAAGWCLAQHVYFQRPDWAAALCGTLQQQHSSWYSQKSMNDSIASWGGDSCMHQINAAMGVPVHGG